MSTAAVFSDIHAHWHALQVLLADLEQQQPDHVICLGDVATIGPQPREVLDALQTLDCVFIQGNHDESLLHPERSAELNIAAHLLETQAWTAAQLTAADHAFLASFQRTYRLDLDFGHELFCYHGSPRSTIEQLLPTTAESILDELFSAETATVLAGGHTHFPMVRPYRDKLLVNPGGVGHTFLGPLTAPPQLMPYADYMLIHSDASGISVTQRRLNFDTNSFRIAVKASGIPIQAWWNDQY